MNLISDVKSLEDTNLKMLREPENRNKVLICTYGGFIYKRIPDRLYNTVQGRYMEYINYKDSREGFFGLYGIGGDTTEIYVCGIG